MAGYPGRGQAQRIPPTPGGGNKPLCLDAFDVRRLKSPIGYPGGKSLAVKQILAFIPVTTTTLVSPFIGGGSIELACTARGVRVHGYDIDHRLVNYWNCMLTNPRRVSDEALKYIDFDRKHKHAHHALHHLRETHDALPCPYQKSGVYLAVNKLSFSNLAFAPCSIKGGRSHFTRAGLHKAAAFKAPCLTVAQAEFPDSLAAHPDAFIYADPPYILPASHSHLYGDNGAIHREFDHIRFAEIMLARRAPWVLSYNDHELTRDFYKGCRFIQCAWHYPMSRPKKDRSKKPSNEVVILSKDHPLASA